jgi:hypothetical protein
MIDCRFPLRNSLPSLKRFRPAHHIWFGSAVIPVIYEDKVMSFILQLTDVCVPPLALAAIKAGLMRIRKEVAIAVDLDVKFGAW